MHIRRSLQKTLLNFIAAHKVNSFTLTYLLTYLITFTLRNSVKAFTSMLVYYDVKQTTNNS